MRTLVLGGTGYLGRQVVEVLLEAGHEVTVVHRGQKEVADGPEIRHVHGDRSQIGDLASGLKIDGLVDVAPMNDEDSRVVVDAFRGRIERSVHVSSVDVYEAWGAFQEDRASRPVPFDEEAPLRKNLYLYRGKNPRLENYDKILMERTVLGAGPGFPACVVRFPVVYGPWDRQRREWGLLRRILGSRPVLMGGGASWLVQRVFVRDAARAIALVLGCAEAVGHVFNVGEPSTMTMRQWAEAIGCAAGREVSFRVIPDSLLPAHLAMYRSHEQHIITDTGKIRRIAGYCEERSAEENLRTSVAWHMANPPAEDLGDYAKQLQAEDAALAALPGN
jgi:nucleoside-diphosphate-sugar epimerase